MRVATVVAGTFAGLLLATWVQAQGPPIYTDTPILLGLEGRGVRVFGDVVTRRPAVPDGEPRETTTTVFPIVVPVNLLSPRFQIGVIAPVVDVRAGSERSTGPGNVRLFGKYLLYQRDGRNETFRVATKAGVVLPSGDDSATPPLGSGTTDYFMTVVGGYIRGRIGLYGEGILDVRGANGSVDFGNAAGYNAALGYRLYPARYGTYPSRQINLFFELNGTTASRSRRDGTPLSDTGGTLVLAAPGVQYIGGRRWLVEGGVRFPLIQRPNGKGPEARWAARVGFRVLLF